jgi:hypothetical protein
MFVDHEMQSASKSLLVQRQPYLKENAKCNEVKFIYKKF